MVFYKILDKIIHRLYCIQKSGKVNQQCIDEIIKYSNELDNDDTQYAVSVILDQLHVGNLSKKARNEIEVFLNAYANCRRNKIFDIFV